MPPAARIGVVPPRPSCGPCDGTQSDVAHAYTYAGRTPVRSRALEARSCSQPLGEQRGLAASRRPTAQLAFRLALAPAGPFVWAEQRSSDMSPSASKAQATAGSGTVAPRRDCRSRRARSQIPTGAAPRGQRGRPTLTHPGRSPGEGEGDHCTVAEQDQDQNERRASSTLISFPPRGRDQTRGFVLPPSSPIYGKRPPSTATWHTSGRVGACGELAAPATIAAIGCSVLWFPYSSDWCTQGATSAGSA